MVFQPGKNVDPIVMRAGSEVFASGLGAALTDTIFNPLEILKVRRQLVAPQESLAVGTRTIWSHGGVLLLWTPGLQATWTRAFCVTGMRVGLYPTVRQAFDGDSSTSSVASKVSAGMATGALSAALANPIDMVRTRIHAQVAAPQRYPTTLSAAAAVVRDEGGIAALWRGLGATVSRQVLLSGGQLATYDQAKHVARTRGFEEGAAMHVVCAGLSGCVAQLACMPADVIKTKVLSGEHGASVWGCLVATLRREGIAGLYRGFLPAVTRQCPVILVQMPLIEQIRTRMGLGTI